MCVICDENKRAKEPAALLACIGDDKQRAMYKAAPALLEACRLASDWFVDNWNETGGKGDLSAIEASDKLLAAIDLAAIALAEGGA